MDGRGLLLKSGRLWSRAEILARPCPVPREPGVYAWYVKEVPPGVATDGCVRRGGYTLLYVGISPKRPPRNGMRPSRQTLCHRLRYHMRGNAEGSTLRLTLGCLLEDHLGIRLRRVGGGGRMTFAEGEGVLSEWLGENALAAWCVHPEPWELEEELIREVSLPLNLAQNRSHPFYAELTAARREAKLRAADLPVVR